MADRPIIPIGGALPPPDPSTAVGRPIIPIGTSNVDDFIRQRMFLIEEPGIDPNNPILKQIIAINFKRLRELFNSLNLESKEFEFKAGERTLGRSVSGSEVAQKSAAIFLSDMEFSDLMSEGGIYRGGFGEASGMAFPLFPGSDPQSIRYPDLFEALKKRGVDISNPGDIESLIFVNSSQLADRPTKGLGIVLHEIGHAASNISGAVEDFEKVGTDSSKVLEIIRESLDSQIDYIISSGEKVRIDDPLLVQNIEELFKAQMLGRVLEESRAESFATRLLGQIDPSKLVDIGGVSSINPELGQAYIDPSTWRSYYEEMFIASDELRINRFTRTSTQRSFTN